METTIRLTNKTLIVIFKIVVIIIAINNNSALANTNNSGFIKFVNKFKIVSKPVIFDVHKSDHSLEIDTNYQSEMYKIEKLGLHYDSLSIREFYGVKYYFDKRIYVNDSISMLLIKEISSTGDNLYAITVRKNGEYLSLLKVSSDEGDCSFNNYLYSKYGFKNKLLMWIISESFNCNENKRVKVYREKHIYYLDEKYCFVKKNK